MPCNRFVKVTVFSSHTMIFIIHYFHLCRYRIVSFSVFFSSMCQILVRCNTSVENSMKCYLSSFLKLFILTNETNIRTISGNSLHWYNNHTSPRKREPQCRQWSNSSFCGHTLLLFFFVFRVRFLLLSINYESKCSTWSNFVWENITNGSCKFGQYLLKNCLHFLK